MMGINKLGNLAALVAALGLALFAGRSAEACGASPDGRGGVAIEVSTGQGYVMVGGDYYEDGDTVYQGGTYTAVPAEGYRFVKWFSCADDSYYYSEDIELSLSEGTIKGLYVYFEPIVPVPSALRVYQSGAKGSVKMTVGKTVKSVTGGKTLAASVYSGKTVKLMATPPSGYVFEGWDRDSYEIDLPDKKWRQTTISFNMPASEEDEVSIWALYVKKSQDYVRLYLDGNNSDQTWIMEDEEDEYEVTTDSISYASLSASGVPAGMKLVADSESDDMWHLRVVDPSKLKKGTSSVVTLTAKNRSGKKSTRKLKIVLPNRTTAEDLGLIEGVDTENGGGYSFTAGMTVYEEPLELWVQDGWTLTVSGLPTGLKWNASSRSISGVPSKVGTFVTTFKVTKGKTSYSVTALFTVTPMPDGISGTYTGYTMGDVYVGDEYDEEWGEWYEVYDCAFGKLSRKVKVTIGAGGAIVAKIGSVTLKGNGLEYSEGKYRGSATLRKKSGSGTMRYSFGFEIDPNAGCFEDQLTGSWDYLQESRWFGVPWNLDYDVRARRVPFGEAASVVSQFAELGTTRLFVGKASSKEYSLECEACIYCPYVKTSSGYKSTCSFPVSAKVSATGAVTISGKIAGKKVSGTTQIEIVKPTDPDDWVKYRGYARFILAPDSKTTMFIELEYVVDEEYGAYQPSGWAKIK